MILTVGDSFTYGEELTTPTVDAWPHLLGLDVLNLGKPASSIDRIFRVTVEETSKQHYTGVIVAWSFPNRLEVCEHKQPTCVNFNNRRKVDWVDGYFKYAYDEDFSFRKWFGQILALQGYLKSISQPYIFCNVAGLQGHYSKYLDVYSHLLNNVDPEFYTGWPIDGMLEWQGDCPKGPGGHPLELGHQRIAERINEHIRHLGWLS